MENIVKANRRHRVITAFSRLTDGRVLSNIRWTFIGNALYAASQWAMIVVLARCTDPQTVGTFALAVAITAPVMIFFNMQLRAIIATDVTGKYELRQYFQTRLLTVIAALVLTSLGLLAFHESAATNSVIMVIALSKAAESLSDIIHGHWQLIERMELVGKSLTIRAFLTLAAFTLAMVTTRSLVWGSVAFLVGSLSVLVAYDAPRSGLALFLPRKARRSLATLFNLGDIQNATPLALIRLALPLGVAAMLISLNTAIPRYFVQIYCGKRELGIFAALSYYVVVGNLCLNAIGQSVLPRLARLYKDSHKQFNQMLAALIACSGVVAALSMGAALLFGRRLLGIYGPEYADAYPVFLIIMAAASVGYGLSVLNFSLTATGAYKVQVPLFATIALILAILCRIWVPAYGMAGGATVLLLCNGIQAVIVLLILASLTRTHSRQSQCTVH